MITGESNPVAARARATGSWPPPWRPTRRSGCEVDAVGEDTALAGIQRLVAEAQASSSRTQVLADRAAALLFYVALVAAVLTVSVWSCSASPTRRSCGGHGADHRLPPRPGPGDPAGGVDLHVEVGAQGILVKDRLALEQMRTVDVVLFDKTGTLTKGEHAVTGCRRRRRDDTDALLALAAAVEADSEHPLARAIVAAARERGVDVPRPGVPSR
jgi:P-type Cu2+ transporter